VRGCAIDVVLPAGFAEAREGEPIDAVIASVDAGSIEAAAATLEPRGRDVRVAWVIPVTRGGVSGVLSWMQARTRRLRPMVIEDACDAFRRGGVTDVRVVAIAGSLGLALVSGRLAPTL